MEGGLPEGLVTHNDAIAGEYSRLHDVDVDDIIKMWKVYTASKAILPNDSGRRLANFLWRVWGVDNILYNLTGSQLAAYFSAIAEDGPLRTTPTQSPRTSRHLSSAAQDPRARTQPLPLSIRERNREEKVTNTGEAGTPQDETSLVPKAGKPDVVPPSILKKTKIETSSEDTDEGTQPHPSMGQGSAADRNEGTSTSKPSSTALAAFAEAPVVRLKYEPPGAENLPPQRTESSSTLRSASSEDTVKPRSEAAPKARRKKTVFHAANPRKRPVGTRRKSSQSSSSNTPSTISPRPSTAPTSLIGTSTSSSDIYARSTIEQRHSAERAAEDVPQPQEVEQESRFSLPQLEKATESSQPSLVEADFRSKFVEKTRSAQSSYVNLPSLLRKPNPTTATSASHTTGTMDTGQPAPAPKSRSKVTFTEGSKPPGPAGPELEAEDKPSPLPRTMSQLTLLLEKDRRAGGGGQGRKGSQS